MATVAEVHAALSRLMQDGNGGLPLVATVNESGKVQHIIDVEVMDDPPYLVLSAGDTCACGLGPDASLHTQTAEQCREFMVEANGPGSDCNAPEHHHRFGSADV